MRQKDSSQSSLNYWGSSSSNNRQVLLFWLSGHTKISMPWTEAPLSPSQGTWAQRSRKRHPSF